MSIITYRYRIKDSTSGARLARMASAVNFVWNFCQEVSLLAFRREKRFLSAFDLITLTIGASKDLGIHSDTISEICRQYVQSRTHHKGIRLKWRSKKRSLGWVPFTLRAINLQGDTVFYRGHTFRFWLSRPLQGIIKTGSFSQDARRHWYVNFHCEVEDPGFPTGEAELGIDLGLQDQIVCSDGVKYSRENLTRRHKDSLAMADRAHKKRRVKAIHAKVANQRKDWAHKTTTTIIRRACIIAIGNVSSARLLKTNMAASVMDAGWSRIRSMLAYKAIRLGVEYCEVNESWSSVTCSACGNRTGPRGLSHLDVREWCCDDCGTVHDRDTNAAQNILHTLRSGRRTPTGILSRQ